MDTPRFTGDQLAKLRDDAEFNRRIGGDVELAALFNPHHEDSKVRAELAQGLGVSRTIAGVTLAPVRLGHLTLLTVVGNEFAKIKPDWRGDIGYMMRQLTEALFVLANGPKCVAAYADGFRFAREIDAHKADALTSPAIAGALVEAQRKHSETMRTWDAAVLAWGADHVVLSDGETLDVAMHALDEWIARALAGFDMFPKLEQKEDAAKAGSPFGWRLTWRLALSRRLVKCAAGLILRGCAGGWRFRI